MPRPETATFEETSETEGSAAPGQWSWTKVLPKLSPWTPTSNIPFGQRWRQITLGEYQGQTAPADIVPPDGTGDGKKPPTVAGAKVTTGQLMVKMGQVKKGFKESNTPGRSDISKFEKHVRHEWLIPRHPQCVMGPLRLRTRRIEGRTGFELWEAAISDFIQC